MYSDNVQAVELILKPRPGEATFRDVMEAREIWWESRNASDALKALTRKDKSIEGKVLMGLRRHGPNAYQNAFDNVSFEWLIHNVVIIIVMVVSPGVVYIFNKTI